MTQETKVDNSSMAGSEYQEVGEEEEVKLGPIRRFMQKTWVRVLVFLISVGFGAVSVMFDWLWVADMVSVQKALVFGPARFSTIAILIFVSSIGTVCYFGEIVNNAKKVCNKDPFLDENITQVIVLLVEEIPTTALNMLLASCREAGSSTQMVKAGVGILGSGIRVLFTLFHYFTPRRRGMKTGFFPWFLRTIIMTACACVFAGNVTVFIYTYSDPPGYGSDGNFKPPETVIEKAYDNGRYLYRSAVYFSHPTFARCNNNTKPWSDSSINWIKIGDLYDIIDLDEIGGDLQVTFSYSAGITSYIHIKTGPYDEVCYRTSYPDCSISYMQDCDDIPADLDKIEMKMVHTPRTKTIVFGDIKVKALETVSKQCNQMSLDDDGYFSVNSNNRAQILYFQASPSVNETFAYIVGGNGKLSHYSVLGDLNYVEDVWLTGYKLCPMSGAKRPNLDNDLNIIC